MAEVEYEYRALKRVVGSDEWLVIYTNRGAGRPFRTLGGAKGVVTRESRLDRRRNWNGTYPEYEYKVQRRPVSTEWEDA